MCDWSLYFFFFFNQGVQLSIGLILEIYWFDFIDIIYQDKLEEYDEVNG